VRERVLAIVNLIAKYVLGTDDAPISEQELVTELLSVGFEAEEISDAFSWMEAVALQPSPAAKTEPVALEQPTYRIFSREERQALEPEALGFLVRLRTLGILSDAAQEEVIERAVQSAEDPISLQEVKLIAALTLLSHSSNLWQREIDCFFDSDWTRIYH
jgi:Smg protein